MKCEQVRDELVAYARGELRDDARAVIEEHLVRCEGCSKELEGVRQVLALAQTADDESIVGLVNDIIKEAIRRGASDIHFEAARDGGVVRVRIDGVLHAHREVPRPLYGPAIARLKLMAEIPLTERRIPQDGRIAVRCAGKDYDLRVSTIPFHLGEGAVARILDQSSVMIGLEKLGLRPAVQSRLEDLISQAQGLFIATGPTGSGKTTTLYSILHRLNRPEVKIVTVEDPVEYLLGGISQAPVNRKEGMTFAAALRGFLRHDPDILMAGAMRDLETAEICVEAALTGHFVLSVLHTRDAVEALTRLRDIGIEPFLIASTVNGVLGQRLARLICPSCREPYTPGEGALAALGFTERDRPAAFYHGAGCEACGNTGYRGRTGLFDLLAMNDALKRMVSERAPEEAIRARAIETGALQPFVEDARIKVAEGLTTAEEAERVLEGILPRR